MEKIRNKAGIRAGIRAEFAKSKAWSNKPQ